MDSVIWNRVIARRLVMSRSRAVGLTLRSDASGSSCRPARRAPPEEQPATFQAECSRHKHGLDHLGPQPGKFFGFAAAPGDAKTGDRAGGAERVLAQADGGAQFHHCLVVRTRVGTGDEGVGQRSEMLHGLGAVAKQTLFGG
jgi:hypothetical protein